MNKFKHIMVWGLVTSIAACPLYTYSVGDNATEVQKDMTEVTNSNELNISGVVTYNRLETGFYEVDGYRLVGDFDFSKYEGKDVVIKGELDNSISIFMTRAIKVISIDEVNGSDLHIVSEQLVLEGPVLLNSLEGGYYEVKGFRLTGDYSFGDFEGKVVSVAGVEDTGPSIYMNKALQVNSIELIDEGKYFEDISKHLDNTMKGLEDVIENMPEYIKQYGENSSEVNLYNEELRTLRMDAVNFLEELIRVNGKNVDIDKYEMLGKVLDIREEKVISIYIDGVKTGFEQDALPFIDNGRTLVPFRVVAESLGAEVFWFGDERKVTVSKDGRVVELTIGTTTAYVDGKPVELDVPAKIVQNRTMIPLRFVGESLDTTVDWIPKGQIVVIRNNSNNVRHLITNTDFTVKNNDYSIKIGDWDDKINISEILGEPVSQKTEQLGHNADTFTGSYIKEMKYEGLVLRLMSPKDNGKTFHIDQIKITGEDFITARGIKVGDSYERILEEYTYKPLWETNYDSKNHEYIMKDESYNYIKFDVGQGVVKSIDIYAEHP